MADQPEPATFCHYVKWLKCNIADMCEHPCFKALVAIECDKEEEGKDD